MRIALIDNKASKATPYLLVAAVSAIITSWALKTPELGQKADKLQVEETKVIPHLKDVAGCQTARARVATKLANASEQGANINLSKIPNCPLLPAKAPIPIPAPNDPSLPP